MCNQLMLSPCYKQLLSKRRKGGGKEEEREEGRGKKEKERRERILVASSAAGVNRGRQPLLGMPLETCRVRHGRGMPSSLTIILTNIHYVPT